MEIIKVKDYQDMSREACSLLVDTINKKPNSVLGLATGSTPEGLYQQLIKKYQQKEVSFQQAKTFNLDEYVGIASDDPNSYYYFMNEKLFNHIDIQKGNTHIPNGMAEDMDQECRDYEQLIRKAEHMDIQLLGLGLNGHIGFNEPGTPLTSRTHIVELDESTRMANARFFNTMNEVPKKAITMGIDTIMESKKIMLLVSGEKKAGAVKRLVDGDITEEFPASILQKHHDVTVIADEAALLEI
ncbi:glucosamine-6-phosphate deaminase [Virgibacillus oceani]|uniref:Glucosamine-6-phosphate deaminase n=1 Tax=Virgibacillus oceani TaxID=1479511 RepID=A0A917H564_9BACI|nr:glucosamine-6-phosphate deaminase [Virgibacillus oceani]GGG67445.1 glucosamine-6-phosphate deaminase 1 [Virgibacillus oceani]